MIGTSDSMGCATSEILYTEYGEPLVQWIIYCASASGISTVSYDSTYKETTVTLNATLPGNLEGKEVRVAVPGDDIRPYRTARVQHASGTTMVLYEPTADSDESVAAAIDPAGSIGAPFVAYDNPTGMLDGRWDDVTEYAAQSGWPDGYTEFQDFERVFTDWWVGMDVELQAGTGGLKLEVDEVVSGKLRVAGHHEWAFASSTPNSHRYRAPDLYGPGLRRRTSHGILYTAPSYDPGADETTFTVEPLANLASFQVGYKVLLDTRTPTYHTITAAGGDTFTVKGQLTPTMGNTDAHEIGSAGDWFRVMTPYGKDAQTGELDQELSMKGSRQGLWGGYRWMPPEGPNGSTASFSNKYYCHNRTYDTRTGRWSTPDPAASPWCNLQDYVGANPLMHSDPSGLDPEMDDIRDYLKWKKKWEADTRVDKGNWEHPQGEEGIRISRTEECEDCEGCHYTFTTILKTGDYLLFGRKTLGVYNDIGFSEGAQCPETQEVTFYQAMAETRNGDVVTPHSTWDQAIEKDGWFMDVTHWGGRGNDGSYPASSQNRSYGSSRPRMLDAPGWFANLSKNRGKRFHTCAVGTMKDGSKRVLACLRWEFAIDSDQKISTKVEGASCGATDEFRKAMQEWDMIGPSQLRGRRHGVTLD